MSTSSWTDSFSELRSASFNCLHFGLSKKNSDQKFGWPVSSSWSGENRRSYHAKIFSFNLTFDIYCKSFTSSFYLQIINFFLFFAVRIYSTVKYRQSVIVLKIDPNSLISIFKLLLLLLLLIVIVSFIRLTLSTCVILHPEPLRQLTDTLKLFLVFYVFSVILK